MSVSPISASHPGRHLVQPRRRWRWAQRWQNLIFAHWQVPCNSVSSHLPVGLEIDTWQGAAWVSIVGFQLDVRLRGLPYLGPCTNFVELNLRTYVRCPKGPAIYFLSIHASRRTAVTLARMLTPLPYVYAPLSYFRTGDEWELICRGEASLGARPQFHATFSPGPACGPLPPGSLDAWLLERYCAVVLGRRGKLHQLVVQHPPWFVHSAKAQIRANTLGAPWRLDLGHSPDATHFLPSMAALLWPFEPWTP